MNLRIALKACNFLNGWRSSNFSRSVTLHGVYLFKYIYLFVYILACRFKHWIFIHKYPYILSEWRHYFPFICMCVCVCVCGCRATNITAHLSAVCHPCVNGGEKAYVAERDNHVKEKREVSSCWKRDSGPACVCVSVCLCPCHPYALYVMKLLPLF